MAKSTYTTSREILAFFRTQLSIFANPTLQIRRTGPFGFAKFDRWCHQFQQTCFVSGTSKGKGKVKEGQALKRSKITIKKGGPQQPTSDPETKGQRKSQLEVMVDGCLQSKAPVRFLKPKERAREAEREKMGLLSENRKLEIANFRKSAKMGKDEAEVVSGNGSGRIGPDGLDLITLGVVDGEKISKYELTVEDGMKLAKEYSRILMRKHRARQAAETGLLKCKEEAIEALPEKLKEKALVPDLEPFPVNRFMATLTPPIEGYIEKIKEAAKRQETVKGKLR